MPVEIRVPAMGEGITDVTIIKWLVVPGEKVKKDTPLVEIATDKVDSEIISTYDGIIELLKYTEGSVVKIGESIAIIATENDSQSEIPSASLSVADSKHLDIIFTEMTPKKETSIKNIRTDDTSQKKFISPFVRQLAMNEGISVTELESISGTGVNNRITKDDILLYIENQPKTKIIIKENQPALNIPIQNSNEIHIELDRMRKLIANNMLNSKKTSPHVTSFVEANVTKIVNWREKVKIEFQKKYNEKLTFLPLVIHAVAKALKDYPTVNASLQNDTLVIKNDINIGIATALPNGNLIVPVIKKADTYSIEGLVKIINSLTQKARDSKLSPADIQGGTFTVSNIGTFGNIGGTPIINQPELAILAIGTFIKKPIAVNTNSEYGIAIQDITELWLSYDHRIIDGFLGGSFLKRIADYLEQFDEITGI